MYFPLAFASSSFKFFTKDNWSMWNKKFTQDCSYFWGICSLIYFLIFVIWLLLVRANSENVDLTLAVPRTSSVCIHTHSCISLGFQDLSFPFVKARDMDRTYWAFLALKISKLLSLLHNKSLRGVNATDS